MTDVTMPRELSSFRAWVIPGQVSGEGVFYEWDLSKFEAEPALIVERISSRPCGMGTASMRLLRIQREENGDPHTEPGNTDLGAYLAITADVGLPFTVANVIFWGFISRRDLLVIKNGQDQTGSITALGLGYLLDGTQLAGFQQASAASGPPSELISPPTFNLEGDGGTLIGNRITDSASIPVFAALPSLCAPDANLWSRKNVLDHVLKYCKPDGMPAIAAIGDSSTITYLGDTASREVFDLSGVTLKGAIDLLVSRTHGFGWNLAPNAGGTWNVVIYPMISTSSAPGSGYPTATTTNVAVADSECVAVAYAEDAGDLYDSVTVEGDRVLFGVTASFADGNLAKGWTTAQETSYRAGAKAATDYNNLSAATKRSRNEQIRNSAELSDVFALYTLLMTSTAITRSATPGAGGNAGPLVPTITWSGTAASVTETAKTPYLPSARLSRIVPWLAGVKGDGTDDRDAAAKARPEFLSPRVFKYDTAETGGVCEDLLVPSIVGFARPSPTVTPDDRTPGLRVEFSPNEFAALNNWTTGTDGISRIGNVTSGNRCFDYTKLALTIGVSSDQRVSVSLNRTGVADEKERRDLMIRDSKLQCWVALAGTIVGTNKDGGADRVATTTFVRNDFPAAQRMATVLAAFAFRKRTSATITLAEPDNLPAWAAIGTMLGTITEEMGNTEVNTVVESIDYDLTYERPRVTIGTTLPTPPVMGGGSASPSAGGPVSGALGGTVSQAVSSAQADLKELGQRTAKIPTNTGITTHAFPAIQLIIDQGNTLSTGQLGCKVASPVPSIFPTAYNPETDTSYIDGVCRAQVYFNGVYVGFGVVVNRLGVCLLQGDVYTYVGDAANMPVTASSALVPYYSVL